MNQLTYQGRRFYLDGEPFVIRSGSIHYFRVVPEYWEDRLKKLKACGLNTVETYTCWNLHEPEEGRFDFSGMLDLERFLEIAEKLGLLVILRPGPYICAEFDFGGLPSWLLRYPQMKIRCNDPLYLSKVEGYFHQLFARIRPHLAVNGGTVIAMQLENEYGSYGDDQDYLRALADIYRKEGMDCLWFTSDGPGETMAFGGSLPEYLETFNFGSRAKEAFGRMRPYFADQPMMCCEFWDGWFDHWHEEHHTRSAEDAAQSLKEILDEDASFNLYMFHGGTNFAYTSGANYGDYYAPTVTSYDYDAPVSECGDLTPKFYAIQKLMAERFGDVEPIEVENLPKQAYGTVTLTQQAGLLEHAALLSQPVKAAAPMAMEDLGKNSGYLLYTSTVHGPLEEESEIFVDGLCDRGHIFVNGKLMGIKDRSCGRDDKVTLLLKEGESAEISILVENMGHVNYGRHIWEKKGILQGVRLNYRHHFGWTMTPVEEDSFDALPFEQAVLPKPEEFTPTVYRGSFSVDKPADTFLKLDGFQKGIVLINGFHLGRYWNTSSPQRTLYVPGPVLKQGENQITVLELDGTDRLTVEFLDYPILGE